MLLKLNRINERNGYDEELGSLFTALAPKIKTLLTAKNSDGSSKAGTFLKKGVTSFIKKNTAKTFVQKPAVQYLPAPQIIQPPAQTIPITFSDLHALLRPQVTEYVPPQPKPMPQIIQPLQPQTNDNQKLLIGLGVGAGVLVLLGFTYAITRRQPTQLSGLPSIKIGRHPKKLKKLKNLKTIKAL